jgi:hypothetical protein
MPNRDQLFLSFDRPAQPVGQMWSGALDRSQGSVEHVRVASEFRPFQLDRRQHAAVAVCVEVRFLAPDRGNEIARTAKLQEGPEVQHEIKLDGYLTGVTMVASNPLIRWILNGECSRSGRHLLQI